MGGHEDPDGLYQKAELIRDSKGGSVRYYTRYKDTVNLVRYSEILGLQI